MKYTYYIPEDSKGWSAKSYLEAEKLKDTILGLAISNPSTYIGITSDGRLEFKGVAIRIESYYSGPFCAKVSVQFHDNFRHIKQGFIDLWMLLYDQRIILSEPSERIQLLDLNEEQQKEKESMEQMIKDKKSNLEIAYKFGKSKSTVQRTFNKYGIHRRKRKPKITK